MRQGILYNIFSPSSPGCPGGFCVLGGIGVAVRAVGEGGGVASFRWETFYGGPFRGGGGLKDPP